MKYTKGTLGRVFVLKFDNGDIFLDELKSFARKERVKSGVMVFLGALKKGDIVTGPKKTDIPPKPNWTSFKDGWEVFGVATIFAGSKGPELHVHSALGKKLKTLAGCVRKNSEVFLVIEAVVFELKGVKASKGLDPRTGLNLLKIMGK